jgi:hypothetical protein
MHVAVFLQMQLVLESIIRRLGLTFSMNMSRSLAVVWMRKNGQFLRFQTTDPPQIEGITPQPVSHSLMLLKMGKIIARNMSS